MVMYFDKMIDLFLPKWVVNAIAGQELLDITL